MSRILPAAVALLTVAALAAGCGGDQGGTGMSEGTSPSADSPGVGPSSEAPAPGSPSPADPGMPTSSRTDLPTLRPPTVPPRKPTDARPANVLAGRITRGGAGPCYGLVTDDGREYALYGVDLGTFAAGTWVTVTTTRIAPKIDCGQGTPAGIAKIDPVG